VKRDFVHLLFGSAQQYFFTVLLIFTEFGFLYLVLQRADVAAYGALTFHLGISFIVFQVLDFRPTEVIIRFAAGALDEDPSQFRDRVVGLCGLELAKNMAAASLLLLAGGALSVVVGKIDLSALASIGLFQLLFYSVMGTLRGALRLAGRYAMSGAIPLVPSACRLLLAAAVPTSLLDVHGLSLIYAISGAAALAYFLIALAGLGIGPRQLSPRSVSRKARAFWASHPGLAGYSRDLLVSSWSMIPTKELDVFLLGLFGGFQSVGLYKTAKNLYQAVWTFFDSVQVVCLPVFSKLVARRNWGRLWRLVALVSLTVGASAMLIYAGVWISGGWVLSVLIDGAAEAAAANSVFRLMCIGVLFWGPLFWVSPYLLAVGRSDIFTKAALGTMVATAVGYTIAAWLGQASGLALATAASAPVSLGLMLALAHRAKLLSTNPAVY
jgi:O-antigen/teichoic acid export membrane protein